MTATVEEIQDVQSSPRAAQVAILEAVSKNYGDVCALRGVNFSVHAGELVALLGPNGAGKTTAVKLLLGLMQPLAGKVRVFGGDPTNPQNRMRTGAMPPSGIISPKRSARWAPAIAWKPRESPAPKAGCRGWGLESVASGQRSVIAG